MNDQARTKMPVGGRSARRVPFLWAAVVLATWGPSVPVALAAPSADVLIDQGVELRRAGKDKEALERFQQASKLKDTAKATAQMGLAEEALGLWVASQQHLDKALAVTTDGWINKNRKTIADALAAVNRHVGSVDVWGTPAGAEILFDGELVGTLPLAQPVRVAQEQVSLEVRAPGYLPMSRTIQIHLDTMNREAVALRPAPPPARLAASVSSGAAPPTLATAAGTAEAPSSSSASSGNDPFYGKWWFWTAVGVAVVGATVGGVLLLRSGGGDSCPSASTSCGSWNSSVSP